MNSFPSIKATLVEGDLLQPSEYDLLAVSLSLPDGEASLALTHRGSRPDGEGWNVVSVCSVCNTWATVALRSELRESYPHCFEPSQREERLIEVLESFYDAALTSLDLSAANCSLPQQVRETLGHPSSE